MLGNKPPKLSGLLQQPLVHLLRVPRGLDSPGQLRVGLADGNLCDCAHLASGLVGTGCARTQGLLSLLHHLRFPPWDLSVIMSPWGSLTSWYRTRLWN